MTGKNGPFFPCNLPKSDIVWPPRQDELLKDPRQSTPKERTKHTRYLKVVLERVFAREPRKHWLALLQGAGVVAAPVLSYAEVEKEHDRLAIRSRTPTINDKLTSDNVSLIEMLPQCFHQTNSGH